MEGFFPFEISFFSFSNRVLLSLHKGGSGGVWLGDFDWAVSKRNGGGRIFQNILESIHLHLSVYGVAV